jgi:hypothetical protein
MDGVWWRKSGVCCRSCLLLLKLFVVVGVVCCHLYVMCTLHYIYCKKTGCNQFGPVFFGLLFFETFGLATENFQDQGQLQLVVQSFAVGFSPVPVIFSV